jgi:hypothetical protein
MIFLIGGIWEDEDSFLNSTKRHTSFPMQISTRYLQFGQGEGIGKIVSLLMTKMNSLIG